jgi:hypothetical protein
MLTLQKTSSSKTNFEKHRDNFNPRACNGTRKRVICNICKAPFKTQNHYELFCEHCRLSSETYRFAEWFVA